MRSGSGALDQFQPFEAGFGMIAGGSHKQLESEQIAGHAEDVLGLARAEREIEHRAPGRLLHPEIGGAAYFAMQLQPPYAASEKPVRTMEQCAAPFGGAMQ